MKRVSISGSPRENVGKKDAKMHRAEGRVVSVLYGSGEQTHFTIEKNPFNKIIFTPDVFIIDLEINGKVIPAILQDVQYHPVTDEPLHADFLQIIEGKPVNIDLPVKLKGVAPGIIKGGILTKKLRTIPIKGLVNDIPEFITIDISGLNIGNNIKIRDIDFGKLVPQITEGNLVVGVKTARGAAVGEEDEDGEGEGEGGEAAAAE
ncbi:50S ribosomal protein L25 [Lentimicrobium sp. L6]|uniref:50S ribosomal protein L25 n=1 Tax=Lentimicrobium sp. L6 TaxID=2735916 RepID=UPI001557A1BD|nr:50S ribosomal protein L25 [Lentimicrobium sp. L6]NPD83929.1 50S ribosomal protein L25 [Lentimicrobium sp. L6]